MMNFTEYDNDRVVQDDFYESEEPPTHFEEACIIANRINQDRFEGTMPDSRDTVRLIELLDIIGA